METENQTVLEKNIASLKDELIELKKQLEDLKTKKLSEELQIPEELVAESQKTRSVRRTKRGHGYVPLLESEIIEAQKKTITATDAAKYLHINYYTYRKYAKLYGLWKTNIHYRKEGRIVDPDKGRYPVSKLIAGEFPEYPIYRLKDKLVQSGIKKPECEVCGYKERRITDGKLPLILNFEDGNQKNHKLENVKLLCYNCSFCCGRGYIRRGHKYHVLDDPDRVQGSDSYIPKRF